MSEEQWAFVTPAPGRRDLDFNLLVALLRPSAPPHVWMTDPRGFAMKSEDYRRWMEEGGGPIRVVSPSHVRIFRLDCSPQLDDVMQRLRAEMPQITKELVESRRR